MVIAAATIMMALRFISMNEPLQLSYITRVCLANYCFARHA
jgi:hypothetical protein